MLSGRKYPIGAEVVAGRGVDFRVWAPRSRRVAVELYRETLREVAVTAELSAEADGYFSALVGEARSGDRYRFRLDHGAFPDPASRLQPDGPHGPSQVVDPAYPWRVTQSPTRPAHERVIYELHLGTFTREGTWRAALDELPALARLGVTTIELMPIAEFPGRFGWGYDGVDLFAPSRLYGTPDDARAFVDRAHELGLAVILDVVYNHLGPDGAYLREFSSHYFSARYANEWGEPLNFDGEGSGPVREFFVTNARYWISEFRFDGLRLDATQQIYDASPTHVLTELIEALRREAGDRPVFIVGENETQRAELALPREKGGHGLDALWNDDFHHSARVAATGRADAYYSGYRGAAQEFVSAAKHGFLYQGQWYRWQGKRRGTPAYDLSAKNFVTFLENHDQVANSIHGARLHQLTSPGRWRALTALLLLGPQIPMLFQGQEFAASAPFLYFADHHADLQQQIAKGRTKFLRQFPGIGTPEGAAALANPGDPETFRRSKLDHREREANASAIRLHEDLIRLRREDATIGRPAGLDGAVLGERAFVLRYFSASRDDRLLLVNLDADLELEPAPEPLLAPVPGHGWRLLWSSESPSYGGTSLPPLKSNANWTIPAETAVVLAPEKNRERSEATVDPKN